MSSRGEALKKKLEESQIARNGTNEPLQANQVAQQGSSEQAGRFQSGKSTTPSEWTTTVQLRLAALVCKYKPIGVNRSFNTLAIVDLMNSVYDNEAPFSAIFVRDEDRHRFEMAVRTRQIRKDLPVKSYAPKYDLRPTYEQVVAMLNTWFGMEVCERREPIPFHLTDVSDFKLPDEYMEEDEDDIERDEDGSSTSGPYRLPVESDDEDM